VFFSVEIFQVIRALCWCSLLNNFVKHWLISELASVLWNYSRSDMGIVFMRHGVEHTTVIIIIIIGACQLTVWSWETDKS